MVENHAKGPFVNRAYDNVLSGWIIAAHSMYTGMSSKKRNLTLFKRFLHICQGSSFGILDDDGTVIVRDSGSQ